MDSTSDPVNSQPIKEEAYDSILTCVNSFCFIPVSFSVCPNVLAPLR